MTDNWVKFRDRENAIASEIIPELRGNQVYAMAMRIGPLLSKVGFSDEELRDFSNGAKISPFDHRMQHLLAYAVKYHEIKSSIDKVKGNVFDEDGRSGGCLDAGN